MIKPSDIELSRQLECSQPWVPQGLKRAGMGNSKRNHPFYNKLKAGLKIYCSIENGKIEPIEPKENKALKLFCECNKYNPKYYILLNLAGVRKVGDLFLRDEDGNIALINDNLPQMVKNWNKVKGFE